MYSIENERRRNFVTIEVIPNWLCRTVHNNSHLLLAIEHDNLHQISATIFLVGNIY
jgi:hypothetical protein